MHDYVWAQEEPKNMGGQLYVNEFRFSKMEISFKGMQHQPREVIRAKRRHADAIKWYLIKIYLDSHCKGVARNEESNLTKISIFRDLVLRFNLLSAEKRIFTAIRAKK
jgi:hypothetical protein